MYEGFTVGEWVVDRNSGKVGFIVKTSWNHIAVKTSKSTMLLYPDQVELAPLDIREEDILAMQHLAVNFGDKLWFLQLGQRLIDLKL